MKNSAFAFVFGLLLLNACTPQASNTPVPPGCVVSVEKETVVATEQCDLDGDGVGQ